MVLLPNAHVVAPQTMGFKALVLFCKPGTVRLLELGFADAIRREWAWRVSRGESLANLEAFKHLV